jgi:hypothetical protein
MPKQITRVSRNVHAVYCEKEIKLLLLSDLHWDNPKCDRVLLKNHLDEAVKRDAKIILNGDTFCMMQGKYDPRRSKKDIMPEHNKANYIDAVIQDAVNWFGPYKDHILVVGYGNHETAILKALETDPIQRFVDLFNTTHGAEIHAGGYGGVVDFKFQLSADSHRRKWTLRYYHGFGGGGIVTKGVIQDQRMMSFMEGYDCIWQGHVHELYHHINPVEVYDSHQKKIKIRDVHQIRTSSYKEEYEDGFGGFHIERGRPPKPLGAMWLTLSTSFADTKVIPEFSFCQKMYV